MNVLILSAGTRCLLIKAFREALAPTGRVIAADMSENAPAIYEADEKALVPPITASDYMERVLELCRLHRVQGVLSLIDPELSLLAANAARFAAAGVSVLGSPLAVTELCFDKWRVYTWLLENGFKAPKTYRDTESFFAAEACGEIAYPVIVKPVCGSAARAVCLAKNADEVAFYCSRGEEMLIQEYMGRDEIGADAYVDLHTGRVASLFTKEKLLMRAGETDKSRSFADGALFDLLTDLLTRLGARGPVDIDLFRRDGAYYISEINPRFGGGYPHAHACGCNHVQMLAQNLAGEALSPRIGAYESDVYMMKYGEIALRR